ncbi:MAG: hypothetical protein COA63_010880 [Methylophaga sp.]|nr:hypothetical protein [Methylophaga sp.]
MADNGDVLLLLGEIKGELKGMNKRLEKIDTLDNRLRDVEVKAAKNGAISGGVAGIGIALIVEGAKAVFKHG